MRRSTTRIPDAHCVMHTHTTAGMAVAVRSRAVDVAISTRRSLHGKLAYHDFEGITVPCGRRAAPDPQHRRQARGDPAQSRSCSPGATTLPGTFAILWLLNRACEIQVASTAMGPVIDDSRGHPEEMHTRLAAVQSEVRRGPGCVRRADAGGRRDRPVVPTRRQASASSAQVQSAG